ncbi:MULTISPECIES: hypothetical protein [unclassified Caballeronia]|uniref:hypothetical protein n=1 Tax=unclassified Caballeronia TaxID=2646786 RepID=UPI002028DAAE|nr:MULTISPECIES: hypothetical protein [unclassified Caballeronia]
MTTAYAEYVPLIFEVDHRDGAVRLLAIIDTNRPGTQTVQEGVDAVLENEVRCFHLKSGMIVIFRDTSSMWHQVVIDEQCEFVRLRRLNQPRKADAICKVMMLEGYEPIFADELERRA